MYIILGSFTHCVGEGADQEVRGGVGHGEDGARHEDSVGAEAGARSHVCRILAHQIHKRTVMFLFSM